MISIPIYLFAAQWVLLLGSIVLLTLVYRQFAIQYGLNDRSVEDRGLGLGDLAPEFAFNRVSEPDGVQANFEPVGRATVLLFADPSCGACGDAITNLDVVGLSARFDDIRVLVLTAEPRTFVAAVDAFRRSALDIGLVDHALIRDVYKATVMPFFFALGADGRVKAKGSSYVASDIAGYGDRAKETFGLQVVDA